jgi:Mrp family chromosome partitioning ATPase
MSRNFDLLAEIERERESGSENNRARLSADRSAVKDFPANDEAADGPEMLRLVQSIFLSNPGSAPRQVVFFGVDNESGSSSVCAKAGRALASATSKPVCVVDANVRSARLSHIFGVDKTIPFSGKFASMREPCVQVGGNLWLAGTDLMSDGRGTLLPIDELKHRLTQLDGAFEYLLIDAPGTRASKDAELLGHVADAAILVIEADKTRRVRAGKAKESLDAAGVRLLGTVLNNRSFPIPAKLYKLL